MNDLFEMKLCSPSIEIETPGDREFNQYADNGIEKKMP